jgi:hypothetical protein
LFASGFVLDGLSIIGVGFAGKRQTSRDARREAGFFDVFWVFGLKMRFLGKFAHRGAQAARILKPLKNGRAHFKAGFWTC